MCKTKKLIRIAVIISNRYAVCLLVKNQFVKLYAKHFLQTVCKKLKFDRLKTLLKNLIFFFEIYQRP